MKKLGYLFILAIFGFSDNRNSVTNSHPYLHAEMDWENAEAFKEIRLSEMYELDKLILLEFPNDLFLGEVNNIKVKNDRIFVLDNFVSRKIYAFDMNGKFLYAIDDHGEGPDKYSILMDFTLSHDGKEVLVVDSNRRKILHYDAANGKQKRISSLEFPGLHIARIPGGGYVFSLNESKILVITDGQFNKKYETLDKSHGQYLKLLVHFHELRDKTFFMESYNENIYSVSSSKTDVWRKVPTPDYKELEALKNQYPFPIINPSLIMEFTEKARAMARRRSYIEYENGFAFFSIKPNNHKKFVMDFTTGKSYQINYSDIVNDITFTRADPMYTLGNTTENYQGIGYVNALRTSKEEILTNIKKLGENKYSSQMKAIANRLSNDENDQLIFCLFRLKSNLKIQ